VNEAEIPAAAIHEAAHVVTAFHWDVPIGENGVSLTLSRHDVAGFSDTRWTQLTLTEQLAYACKLSGLAGPFTEYMYRDLAHGNVDFEPLISSARLDFASIIGTKLTPETRGAELEMVTNYARLYFLIWLQSEPEEFARRASAETVTEARNLVGDADAMLRAYWDQIAAFADALLSADKYRLSARDVNAWREGHFRRCSVVLREQ
jgi:hypothetical protein